MPSSRVIWLHGNRRVLRLGLITSALLFALSVATAIWTPVEWIRWVAIASAVLLAYVGCLCIYLMSQPRLSYANGLLSVHLTTGSPLQVPIEVVECFFLGQGPALLPTAFGDRDKLEETSNIIVRLAESAEEWKHHDVKPTLGLWCDSYITIRGAWCEPINADLMKRLNDQLIAAHRDAKEASNRDAESASSTSAEEQQVG